MDAEGLNALTQAAARGDRAALEDLLVQHLPSLRAFVRLRVDAAVRERESASDLVQSVCREVLQHGERFQHPDEQAFRRWLYTTALRKIQNRHEFHRAQRRDPGREVTPASDEEQQALLGAYATIVTPSQVAAASEELERLERAMEGMSAEHREVITLSRVVGLSHREVAQEMGRSEGAVRTLLHRALARLVSELELGEADS